MIESLELRIAKHRIEHFGSDTDDIIRASLEGQDCMDCEERLAEAIRAFTWLERSEETIAEGLAQGLIENEPPEGHSSVDEVFELLYSAWLRACDQLLKWADVHAEGGFDATNLAKCRERVVRAESWLSQNEHYKHSKSARDERFSEEPW